MKKSQNIPVWLRKVVLAHHVVQIPVAGKRRSNAVHLYKNTVINMIRVLASVSDWPIIMIGPRNLLSVVPHSFAVPVSVLWVGCKKVYN